MQPFALTARSVARSAIRSLPSVGAARSSSSWDAGRPPLLFTPGPLTTSSTVKQQMLVDVGSRDEEGFLNKMHDVRKRLTHAAGVTQDTHDCVLIQGAGTHAIESVLGSVVGNQQDVGSNHLLILSNGAYGERQKQMCDIFGIRYTALDYPDDKAVSASDLKKELEDNFASKNYTHVSMIHHETTAGVLNPLAEVCEVMDAFPAELPLIVDSMSAFGAYEVDLSGKHSAVKYLISSANKCMEGVCTSLSEPRTMCVKKLTLVDWSFGDFTLSTIIATHN